MKPVCDALCVLACALGATTAALAEQPSPQPMPNGARMPPGAWHGPAVPPGTDAGTPAANSSLPLGTPAALPVPEALLHGVRPLGAPDSSRPPQLTQEPLSRSRPHDAGAHKAVMSDRGDREGNGNHATTLGPAVTSTHDANDFPPGLARCVDLPDRAVPGECAHELYEPSRASH